MSNPDSYSSAAGGSAAPGWYPTGDGYQQYWDGEVWTEHRMPIAGQPPVPAGGQPGYAAYGGPPATTSNDTSVAVLTHLGGAFIGFLVPLIVYLLKKDESPFLRHHAAEALNFHITMFLAMMVSFVLVFVIIGIFLLLALVIGFYVLTIVAAIAANRGDYYRYPLTIRLIN